MNTSKGFQPMDKIAWVKGKNLIPASEVTDRVISLHRESEKRMGFKNTKITMQTYGIIQTAIVRALTQTDDVISRMIKS